MSKTRRHSFKASSGMFKRDLRGKSFFAQGGSHLELTGEVVETDTKATFKRHLDRHMNKHGMEDYPSCSGRWIWFKLAS